MEPLGGGAAGVEGGPVQVRLIEAGEVERWNELVSGHHYLCFRILVGESLKYVAEQDGGWLALLGWDAAAFKCGPRDRWIGWTPSQQLKGARWALWRSPENLTDRQQDTLERLARANRPLYRAYLLKEALPLVFHVGKRRALAELQRWLRWARRSRLAPFVKLARTITNYRASIETALRYRLSNALVESTNQKIRLIIRRGYGFHSAEAIIALAKLSLRGLCPPLPGRS